MLRCKSCEKKLGGKPKTRASNNAFKLAFASFFYSFVLIKLINMLQASRAYGLDLLLAAFLGFGIATLLLRSQLVVNPNACLKIVIPCVLLGTLVCDWTDSLFHWSDQPNVYQIAPVAMILLAIILKFKSDTAR